MLKTADDGRAFSVRRFGLVLSAAPINNSHSLSRGVGTLHLLAWDENDQDGPLGQDVRLDATAPVSAALRLMADVFDAETKTEALKILRRPRLDIPDLKAVA